jgi:hypothetical protein
MAMEMLALEILVSEFLRFGFAEKVDDQSRGFWRPNQANSMASKIR